LHAPYSAKAVNSFLGHYGDRRAIGLLQVLYYEQKLREELTNDGIVNSKSKEVIIRLKTKKMLRKLGKMKPTSSGEDGENIK